MSLPVPSRALGRLQSDLPSPLQLRRVRVQRPFSVPIVEETRRLLPFPHCFAPVCRGQPAICLPRVATELQRAVAVAHNPEEAHGGRLLQVALRQGELPPQAFDAGKAPFVLDRLPKSLIEDFHLGRSRRLVPYARETEQIGRKFRAACMEDEGPAHSEDSTEEARFEDDIVSRGSLTRPRRSGCGHARRRPVILGEHERREVDLMRKLDEPFQGGSPGIEGCHPGIYARDVFDTACNCLQQLLLLLRRAQKDVGFVHQLLRMADRGCAQRLRRSVTLGRSLRQNCGSDMFDDFSLPSRNCQPEKLLASRSASRQVLARAKRFWRSSLSTKVRVWAL